ncbi:hypothetical protein L5515_005021 [Caenorhabditis briggsae]|uniref:Uncharacterized protein n=1 Tax=Caenorhabditis briggsae TaxID=6238 RepID=A0AAE9EN26_CAEBR|nr:hypothetical protein L5515_005020 [Caenorhabditis briggsae]UMM25045.1 hypothetical protein L5515_005021 [Caenorhabditis briggsae]
MSVLVVNFLAAMFVGWRMLRLNLANMKLRRFGVVLVRLLHRDSHRLTGVPQISPLTAHSCRFYWRDERREVTVFEYYYARYGFTLRYPDDIVLSIGS